MSRRGNTHRRDIKSMSFRRENRYAYLDQDADMDNQNLRYGDDRQADIEDSPQGSGCLPRVFNRGRSHQQSSGGSYSQTGRGGGGGGGGGGSGKSFLRRLGLPVGQGRGGGGNSSTGQRGGRGGRKFVENNKNAMMRSSTGGQHTGPLINMVKIPQGRMFGKEFIFRSLSAYVEGDLKPMLFKFSDTGDAIFYLEDNDVTQAVKAANRRISDPKTGSRMIVITSKVAPLWAPLPTNEFQLIKQVMGKRYNETTRVLDLSQFGLDPIFKAANFHASLQRNNVMMAVVQLVDEYFGQVRCIDLSGNRLRFLDYLANLVARTKHVQALNLANNQIDQPLELEKLHGWPLIELTLEGNMFCSRFGADGNAYKSAVHKVFPKVTLLTDLEGSII
uniref:Nuclear RNA export factor Tap RNA-binding domain-containing protein n=1 Tax=Plectus sambesii TaxID=2011161 RepID=A0A914XMW6_9BILA